MWYISHRWNGLIRLYSHLAKQGAVHFSPLIWPKSPVLTPCRARCGTFHTVEMAYWNVKIQLFFAWVTLMFFINWRPIKFRVRPPRALTAQRYFPLKARNYPLKAREISISDRKQPSFWAKKRGESSLFAGFLLFTMQIYNIFRQKANRINISQQFVKC